ncbi:MAG: hypothetical protein WCL25_01680 [bacterium]
MKHPGSRFILAFLAFISVFLYASSSDFYAQELSGDKLPNIIILTFSGVRNSEALDDPTHQYIPNLWGKIFKEGVLYTNVVALNNQFHMPVLHAINTGMTAPFYAYPVRKPSIFQYVSKKYRLPNTKICSLGSWYNQDYALITDDYPQDTYPCALSFMDFDMSPQLKEILTEQESFFWRGYPGLVEKNPERWPNWDSLGDVQYEVFRRILRYFKPKLVHYILNDVESAHADSFARYVLALKKCDERISQIKEFIDSDPYYKKNTYLIINVDHGRNLYYMDHFENCYANPGKVWMYIYGPRIKKGVVIKRPVYHTDIFATVAYLMDVETHANDGKVLKDAFREN